MTVFCESSAIAESSVIYSYSPSELTYFPIDGKRPSVFRNMFLEEKLRSQDYDNYFQIIKIRENSSDIINCVEDRMKNIPKPNPRGRDIKAMLDYDFEKSQAKWWCEDNAHRRNKELQSRVPECLDYHNKEQRASVVGELSDFTKMISAYIPSQGLNGDDADLFFEYMTSGFTDFAKSILMSESDVFSGLENLNFDASGHFLGSSDQINDENIISIFDGYKPSRDFILDVMAISGDINMICDSLKN